MGWELTRPGLSILAQKQLAAWVKFARDWDVYMEEGHVRCAQCKQSITCLSDRNGIPYSYTPDDQWALLVAHIRQAHQEVEAMVYGEDSKADRTTLDNNGSIPSDSNSPANSGLPA